MVYTIHTNLLQISEEKTDIWATQPAPAEVGITSRHSHSADTNDPLNYMQISFTCWRPTGG